MECGNKDLFFILEITVFKIVNLSKHPNLFSDDFFLEINIFQNFISSISPKFPNFFHCLKNSSVGHKNYTSRAAVYTLI